MRSGCARARRWISGRDHGFARVGTPKQLRVDAKRCYVGKPSSRGMCPVRERLRVQQRSWTTRTCILGLAELKARLATTEAHVTSGPGSDALTKSRRGTTVAPIHVDTAAGSVSALQKAA